MKKECWFTIRDDSVFNRMLFIVEVGQIITTNGIYVDIDWEQHISVESNYPSKEKIELFIEFIEGEGFLFQRLRHIRYCEDSVVAFFDLYHESFYHEKFGHPNDGDELDPNTVIPPLC